MKNLKVDGAIQKIKILGQLENVLFNLSLLQSKNRTGIELEVN